MSQENVEQARRAYDAVNRRDLGALLGLMDADVRAAGSEPADDPAGKDLKTVRAELMDWRGG